MTAPNAATVWRDYETDGVPDSGPHEPKKSDVRQWGAGIEAVIAAFTSNGGLIYDTLANLNADLAHDANTSAWVIADATGSNNGIYRKIGASAAGSWSRVADLPYSFITASNVGGGTPNAIVATTDLPIPSVDGKALISLPVFATNTASPVTVAFNGAGPLTIKSNSGSDITVGGLTSGMIVAGYVSGSTFRLLSDQSGAAVLAGAEAAQTAAEDARDEALSAASSVQVTQVSTVAAAEALTPTSAPDFIRTAGFASAGDGGEALYPKQTSEPSHNLKFSITLASSAVAWFGFQGKKVAPELLGPPSDAAGPIQDCIDYLADDASLSSRNGGAVHFGEAEYDIGTTTISLRSGVKLQGLGRGSNADGYLSHIKFTGTGNALAPADATTQLTNVEVADLFIEAPNCTTSIVNAQSIQWLGFRRNWLFGAAGNNPVGLYLPPYVTAKTITGITKADPAVVTAAAHGFTSGQQVFIAGVVGMTQVNGAFYTVANPTADTFELSGTDSSGWSTYTSGGTASHLDTDPTYARISDNYFGGVGTAMDLRDANAGVVSGNRMQPNASGTGIYAGSIGSFRHSLNQTAFRDNSVETTESSVIGYHFGATAYGCEVGGNNRVELPGDSTIGFYAESGAALLNLHGSPPAMAATPIFDPGYAFAGDDANFNNVHAQIKGSDGSILGNSRNVASVTRSATGTYGVTFTNGLIDTDRYNIAVSVLGGIGFAIAQNFATTSVTINTYDATGTLFDAGSVMLDIIAR